MIVMIEAYVQCSKLALHGGWNIGRTKWLIENEMRRIEFREDFLMPLLTVHRVPTVHSRKCRTEIIQIQYT
jgi:hypothetical protein